MARINRRRYGVIPYAANSVQSLELPRNNIFKGLLLQFSGLMSSGAGTTDVAHFENPFSLIRRLRVIRNGSEMVQSLDGGSLAMFAKVNYGTAPPFVPSAVTASQVNVPFSFRLPIDFNSIGLYRESDSLLRAVGTTSLVLEITWGNEDDLASGAGTAVYTVSGVTMQVVNTELMDISGNFADKQLLVIEREVLSTTTDFAIDLAIGPMFRRLAIKATTANGRDASNVLVNNISVRADGSFSHFDRVPWDSLRAINKMIYGLETELTGYAIVDFAEDGNLAGAIETAGASQFQVVLDVTFQAGSVNHVKVIQETLLPSAIQIAA